MKAVFADTFFFLAAVNARDAACERAIAFSSQFQGGIVTTDWIILEVANTLAGGRNRGAFLELLTSLREDPRVKIVALNSDLQRRALELYAQRMDKDWSLTDCVSFLVTSDEGLADALTGDHHFEQAGFNALLREGR